MEKRDITVEVVRELISSQFPQWSHLPVMPVELDGWDNTTFRLGDALSVRLPSADRYVGQVDKEHRWLPLLAQQLPLQIPQPVAMGEPSGRFPRPWSVYRWIEGEPASTDRVRDATTLAADLAKFLVALEAAGTDGAPAPGTHNFWRGGPLDVYDESTRAAIDVLGDDIDRALVMVTWDAAKDSVWDRPPVWVHGDVAPSNLLVVDGSLRAVIDFGCSAVGDPACDLAIAWTYFDGASREAFRDGVLLDADTWRRGQGWALWKALITLAQSKQGGVNAHDAARRWGWRFHPSEVVNAIVADAR